MSNQILMAKAIQNLASGCKFGVRIDASGDAQPVHKGGDALPSNSDISAEITRITTSETARDNRAKNYPDVREQLDLLYHAIDADSDLKTKFSGFHTALKNVKDAYSKS